VVHFDIPADPKDYVHRSGRTGRAGNTGTVVALIPAAQKRDAAKLARQAGVDVDITEPQVASLPEGHAAFKSRGSFATKGGTTGGARSGRSDRADAPRGGRSGGAKPRNEERFRTERPVRSERADRPGRDERPARPRRADD